VRDVTVEGFVFTVLTVTKTVTATVILDTPTVVALEVIR